MALGIMALGIMALGIMAPCTAATSARTASLSPVTSLSYQDSL